MKPLRIGTRGSRLALLQSTMVADALRAAHPDLAVEIVEIRTSGDWKPEQGETRLSEVEGGKGQFAREIELAILAGAVDCGVHSLKDMPSFLPEGLALDHMMPREDARDVFLSNGHGCINDLPQGAVVGTSSLRRQAFLLARRPDLRIVPLRGNVPTRIGKLRDGQVDATVLAYAGIKRLEMEAEIACVIDPSQMLPAVGQGSIGIETREGDQDVRSLFDLIHCRQTGFAAAAERAALQVLNGSCHTPIGAYATIGGMRLTLEVAVASPDGRQFFDCVEAADVTSNAEAAAIGQRAGEDLKRRVPPHLLV